MGIPTSSARGIRCSMAMPTRASALTGMPLFSMHRAINLAPYLAARGGTVAMRSSSAELEFTMAFEPTFLRPVSMAARLVVSNESVMPGTASCMTSTNQSTISGPDFFCGPILRSNTSAPASFVLDGAKALRKAVVQRFSAIPEMAGMDILCSDKTGTLTLGEMM